MASITTEEEAIKGVTSDSASTLDRIQEIVVDCSNGHCGFAQTIINVQAVINEYNKKKLKEFDEIDLT